MRNTLSVRSGYLLMAASLALIPVAGAAGQSSLPSSPAVLAQAASVTASSRKKVRARTQEIENPSESLEDVARDIGKLEERFSKLEKDYGNPAQPFPVDETAKQYEEATYLYLVEDYDKAALLFAVVLDKAERETFAEYDDAEFYLAESLELGKNYFPALEYFTRIVEYGPSHRYYDPAVVSMVELYGKTGNFEKFSSYYSSYIERNKGLRPTDAILYALGKTFYAQQNYSKSLEIFSQLISAGGNYAYLARYFVGTIHVAQAEYDKAITAFSELLKLSVTTPEQREVEDLSYLALGRLYYEQGDFVRALDNYQNISRDSKYFADALYEESWTFIKKEDYEQAIRTIDILLLTFPDNINVPRLKLVRGLLQQRRKNYDEALDTYQKLVAEYTGIKEELDRITREQKDVLTYFNELLESDLGAIEASFLVPALAVRFATAEKDMTKVLGVARDLKQEQQDLQDSSRLLNAIESEVNGNPPKDLLVGMRKARGALGSLQNAVLLTKERLIQCEGSYLGRIADDDLRSKLGAWAERQEIVGHLSKQLPELERDLTEMTEVYEDQVQEVQKNVFKLEGLIEDLVAQAAAIEKYGMYSRESGTVTPDVEQGTRLKVEAERDQLDQSRKELDVVQRDISSMDVRRYIRQGQAVEENEFRRQAEGGLTLAYQELKALRKEVRGDAEFFASVDASFERLDRLTAAVLDFYGRLDGIEEQQVNAVKASIAREKESLNECGTLAQQYGGETDTLAEQIAHRSFAKIHGHFSDLILRADFGITDVYWELKEEKSKEIEQNQEQRANEIEALQEKFSGLQAGDL